MDETESETLQVKNYDESFIKLSKFGKEAWLIEQTHLRNGKCIFLLKVHATVCDNI